MERLLFDERPIDRCVIAVARWLDLDNTRIQISENVCPERLGKNLNQIDAEPFGKWALMRTECWNVYNYAP